MCFTFRFAPCFAFRFACFAFRFAVSFFVSARFVVNLHMLRFSFRVFRFSFLHCFATNLPVDIYMGSAGFGVRGNGVSQPPE